MVISLWQKAQQILEREFHRSGWTIERPNSGNNDAVVATHGEHRVFLKFDVDGTPLDRLAALRITPALLASSSACGRTYIIQEYVAGSYPDRAWFSRHLPDLAQFIRHYQTDATLIRLLASPESRSYNDRIAQQIVRLERGMDAARTPLLRTRQVSNAFRQLAQQAGQLQPTPLVPTHADPNNKNFLLVRDHFYLLDWDDICLSDPLRDIGLLLWWYVPRERWPEFFIASGLAMDCTLLHKAYWWSAWTSLSVALWFDTHTQDEMGVAAFLTDCYAALTYEDNPHGSRG
jgi:thiamine kinase-like enzyme